MSKNLTNKDEKSLKINDLHIKKGYTIFRISLFIKVILFIILSSY